MNQKKCPKCSELNPQEAVMCWACYTPLAGDGGAVATAAARGKVPAAQDAPIQDEKKEGVAIAPWQIGLIVAALLVAGGSAFMMMGGASGEAKVENNVPNQPPGKSGIKVPGIVKGGFTPPGTTPGGGGTAPMPPQPSNATSFDITTPPGRESPWATVGIVPNSSVSDAQAAALAKVAYQQVSRGRSFKGAYVYVFSDRSAATQFQAFQRNNRGAPLQDDDYVSLAKLWPSTIVRYEYNNGNEDVRYPKSSPNDWWTRQSNYTKASD